jgi:hypothetical protein
VRELAYPLAVLLVAGACFGVVALAVASRSWVAWVLRAGGAIGIVGLAVTAVAFGNLFVPRTCASAETAAGTMTESNRPVLSVVVDHGPCYRSGLAQVQLVVLAVMATSAVSLLVADRRREVATR